MNTISFNPIQAPKISDEACKKLRDKIISKQFAPGQRLNLNEIGMQLGISRTPLKEAVAQLEMEGLIEIVPRSGTYVSNPSPEDIANSFDVRRAIETFAIAETIRLATQEDLDELKEIVMELGQLAAAENRRVLYPQYLELDHKFHAKLVSIANNPRLQQLHERENLHAEMGRVRNKGYEREFELTEKEHNRILQAIYSGDVEQSRKELDAHLERAKQLLLNDMQRSVE